MSERIAVIGMACRFPGANSPRAFWENLRNGVESITFRDHDETDPRFVAAKGILDGADSFDATFFGIPPREAALMDPQQRVFLETAWSALEDAGYDAKTTQARIGVFAGSILSVYLVRNLWPNRELMSGAGNFQIAVGNDPTFLATSTSYQLDLRGPSVSVGTACSTSLVAVHLACQSLLAYESDMALAGGVSVHLPLEGGYRYEDGGILSPDGHCRPFDASAQGTVSSDGAGIVVLKRLSDALADGDTIHAVILGSAMNNDGRLKVGYTAPSGPGETQVIAEAMAMADVTPDSISMIEAHGAGTLLGDPIEVAALSEAFGDCDGQRNFCALGSVKSNIGHVDAAAGIAGLIKTILALEHREIPPTLHFQTPNPQIDFARSPFYVPNELRAMTRGATPLRAGVSSFGIGGTNVHVVLEEPPASEPSTPSARPFELLMFSAKTASALEAMSLPVTDAPLADVAFTLRNRRPFPHRRIDVTRANGAVESTASGVAPTARPSIAFLFPGLGDHYAGMGWELYCTEPVFHASIDRSAQLLAKHLGSDIRDFLYRGRDWSHPVLGEVTSGGTLDLRAMLGKKPQQQSDDPPSTAQPGIFVTEVALAELLRSWGIEAEGMIGHSIGEFAAAHLAGVLSLDDALEVVATRARLIDTRVASGAMMAVPLAEDELVPLLGPDVSLGAINAARLCVVSGDEDAVSALAAKLSERGVSAQRLRSTHAYHSHMMESIVEPLLDVLRRVQLRAPRIPYVSCITGTWITEAEATDPNYWARHLCRTVRMHDGLATLLGDPRRVLTEVGPGQGLTSHALAQRRENPVIPLMKWSYGLQSELAVLLRGVGQLWIAGATLDTKTFHARERRRRVPLPTYPFERQRYWIDPPSGSTTALAQKKSDVADWFYLPSWKPSVRGPIVDRGTVLTLDPDADFAAAIREHQPSTIVITPRDYFDLVRLMQIVEAPMQIEVIVTSDAPESAMLRAPAMVAPQEHPGLVVRVIETDDLDDALEEIRTEPRDPLVRYRDGMRYVPSYEPVQLPPASHAFRHRGVYAITGGLGGVGMVLARHLAQRANARLALIGRTPPSDAKRAEIEALGTDVLVIQADVSNHEDMRRALDAIDARFGELHGVIHGAGAVGMDTFREIREATREDAEKQFTAKVRGLRVLDEVLGDRELDFVLLLSSLSAILGGLGFCAYSAANLFMDAYAQRKKRWVSVDWDSWLLGATRPAIAGLGATVSEFVMTPDEGFDAVERILAQHSLRHVVVSTGDLDARLQLWVAHREEPRIAGPRHARPNLSTSYEAPRGELETELAEIWQELFGVSSIGVNDNFFELGGHSLLATQLNARLASRLHVEMSLAALLQAPTIAELAIAVVEHQAEAADASTLEQMLAELTLATGGDDA